MEPLVGLVRSYLALKKGDEAEKLLMARLEEAPEDGAVQNLLGEFYRAREQTDLSELAFRNALKICTDCRAPYLNLGRLLARKGQTADAIQVYREGLASAPHSADLNFALAETHLVQKEHNAAIQIYEDMLARNPDLDAAANNLAALIADFEYQDRARLTRALDLAKRLEESKNPLYLDTGGGGYYWR